jgi:hypothetical protein
MLEEVAVDAGLNLYLESAARKFAHAGIMTVTYDHTDSSFSKTFVIAIIK